MMKKKYIIFATLAAAGVLVLWGVRDSRRSHVPEYLTVKAERTTIDEAVNATGELVPEKLVDIGTRASGQIKKLHVVLGQKVHVGDLIAEIDDETQRNALTVQKATQASAQARLEAARVREHVARRRYERQKALLAEGAAAAQAVDDAKEAWITSRANLTELEAAATQAAVQIRNAQADLAYTRIVSPVAGTVVSIPVEEGQTVNAAQSTPRIVQVADLTNMQNKMQISEGDVGKVHVGMTVRFTTLANPEKEYEARLDSVDPGLTQLTRGTYAPNADNNAAVYYYARARADNAAGRFFIGMTTQNRIVVRQAKDVIAVPNQAISREGSQVYVRVLDDDGVSVRREAVKTGISDGVLTEIVSGLPENVAVITGEAGNESELADGTH